MSFAKRALFVLTLAAWPLLGTGCFYHDIDLETVDHYSHYGHSHTTDLTRYSSDGSDD